MAQAPISDPGQGEPGRWRTYAVTAGFLLPAAVLLVVWVVYPTVYTMYRSLFDREGDSFVGLDNYQTLFTTDILVTAIKNNALWLAVVPALVTAIGLIFAVLTERISWSVAFKTAVFMPMAISLFAAGVIWRIMDQKEPDRGAVNAAIAVVVDAVKPPGALSDAFPSTSALTGTPQTGLTLAKKLQPGDTALLALTGIPPDQVPAGAEQAAQAEAGRRRHLGRRVARLQARRRRPGQGGAG